jgi:LysM repeat protein
VARKRGGWERYAAPVAFLAIATVAVVLVASALHHATGTRTTTQAATTRPTTTRARTAPTTKVGTRRYYTVVAGDTFGAIAAKTGTTVAQIERFNPGVSSTALHIGQKIRVA